MRRSRRNAPAALMLCLVGGCALTGPRPEASTPAPTPPPAEVAADARAADPRSAYYPRPVTPPPAQERVAPVPPELFVAAPTPSQTAQPAATPPAPAPPAPPEPSVLVVFRRLLERQPEKAREVLQRLDAVGADERLALLCSLLAVAESECGARPKGSAREKEREAAALLEQLDRLRAAVQERAPLALHNLCFYRQQQVLSFGNVEPLPDEPGGPAFRAGIDGGPGERVKVYVEVRNFVSRKVEHEERYAINLSAVLKIHDAALWKTGTGPVGTEAPAAPGREMLFPARPDFSRTPRQDYFVTFQFKVPPHLPPGGYRLEVLLRDEADGRVATGALDFRVVDSASPLATNP